MTMPNLKTHFDQVPLEVIQKLLEKELRLQEKVEKEAEKQSIRKSGERKYKMSDGELKFPEWQAPLQDLILEFDREKMPEKMQHVETLIIDRLQQLRNSAD